MPIEIEVCEICGAKHFSTCEKYSPRHGRQVIAYVACDQCGLVFMNPRPTRDESNKYYAESYWESHAADEVSLRKQRVVAESIIGYLDTNFSGWLQNRKSILEVGSSFGVTLSTVGMTVNGRGGNAKLSALEPSVLATQIGAENYAAVELIGTDIDDLQSVSGTFDLIILSHVLEHLQHPVIALRLLASKLAKNGMLFIEVPNYYGHLSVEYAHNYLFTERSLRNALICAGLRVTAFDTRYRVRRVPMYLTTLVDREPSNPAIQKKPLLEYESPQTIRLKRAIGRMFARTYGTWTAIRRAIRI